MRGGEGRGGKEVSGEDGRKGRGIYSHVENSQLVTGVIFERKEQENFVYSDSVQPTYVPMIIVALGANDFGSMYVCSDDD